MSMIDSNVPPGPAMIATSRLLSMPTMPALAIDTPEPLQLRLDTALSVTLPGTTAKKLGAVVAVEVTLLETALAPASVRQILASCE